MDYLSSRPICPGGSNPTTCGSTYLEILEKKEGNSKIKHKKMTVSTESAIWPFENSQSLRNKYGKK